jgi:hypothetical protein
MRKANTRGKAGNRYQVPCNLNPATCNIYLEPRKLQLQQKEAIDGLHYALVRAK